MGRSDQGFFGTNERRWWGNGGTGDGDGGRSTTWRQRWSGGVKVKADLWWGNGGTGDGDGGRSTTWRQRWSGGVK
nr:hypothetical protein [Tanacetum cinerariifolium]